MKSKNIEGILAFFKAAEKLKATYRHSYTSDTKRLESSAEHSWMLAIVSMTIFSELGLKLDELKTLKMVIIHDLAEAVTGDIPTFEVSERQTNKKSCRV